jgi:outer membrane protein OmpA-like peptidoglycan-associated protein
MLRTISGAASAAALLGLLLGSTGPAASHDHDKMCNPVVDGDGEPVIQSDEDIVLYSGSAACPAEVAAATPAEPVAAPEPVKTGPTGAIVYFPTGSAALTPEAQGVIDGLITELKGTDVEKIAVAGYTDTQGSLDANAKLSEKRAQTVAGEFLEAGLPVQVVDTQSFGESQLAVTTDDNVAKQDNRRVEIKIGY